MATTEHSLSLYESLDLLDQAEQSLDSEEGAEAFSALIRAEVETGIAIKLESIHRLITWVEAQKEAAAAEKRRLTEKSKQYDNLIERVRANVLRAMEQHGIKRIGAQTVNFSLRNNPAAVEIVDVSEVPDRFRKRAIELPNDKWISILNLVERSGDEALLLLLLGELRTCEINPDKKAIKEALQRGEDVPGADLKLATSLVIR